MAFDTKKTILLEKQYFYVKAQKGFKLRGTSTEIIPTNTGFYRFLVSNLTFALGNSYIDVFYDSTDMTFQAYCSDLFMENVQNTVTVAVENMNVDLAHFAEQNHSDIMLFATQVGEDFGTLGNGISEGLRQVDVDVKATGDVAHEDAQAIKDAVDNIDLSPVTAFKDANHADLEGIQAKIPSVSGLALDASLQSILAKLGDWLKQATFEEFATVLSTALQLLHTDNESLKTSVDALGKDSSLKALDDSVKAVPSFLAKDATVSDFATGVGGALEAINTLLTAISTSNEQIPSFKSANHSDLASILAKIPSTSGLALDATLSALATALGTALQAVNANLEAVNTGTTEIPNFKAQNHTDFASILAKLESIQIDTDSLPSFSAINHNDLADIINTVSPFKDANHTDLTALLTAFNSLADELKKKLAELKYNVRFYNLDRMYKENRNDFIYHSSDDSYTVPSMKVDDVIYIKMKWSPNSSRKLVFPSGDKIYIVGYASGDSDGGSAYQYVLCDKVYTSGASIATGNSKYFYFVVRCISSGTTSW